MFSSFTKTLLTTLLYPFGKDQICIAGRHEEGGIPLVCFACGKKALKGATTHEFIISVEDCGPFCLTQILECA